MSTDRQSKKNDPVSQHQAQINERRDADKIQQQIIDHNFVAQDEQVQIIFDAHSVPTHITASAANVKVSTSHGGMPWACFFSLKFMRRYLVILNPSVPLVVSIFASFTRSAMGTLHPFLWLADGGKLSRYLWHHARGNFRRLHRAMRNDVAFDALRRADQGEVVMPEHSVSANSSSSL
jgi:hypothetical protein